MVARATLSGSGLVYPSDRFYLKTDITGVSSDRARVTPRGSFVAARVISIVGGSSPQLQILRDGTAIRTVAATNGATIDQRASPDACPNGIFVAVTGNPVKYEVEILYR